MRRWTASLRHLWSLVGRNGAALQISPPSATRAVARPAGRAQTPRGAPRAPRLRLLLWVLYLVPIIFLLLFFAYPLASIFQVSLAPGGRLDLGGLRALLDGRYYFEVLWFTAWQATASTLLTLVLGLPAAYAFARYRFPGKNVLRAITTVPFVMPSTVVAAAFLALLGPSGRLTLLLTEFLGREQPFFDFYHTIWLVLLAHAFYNVSVIIRIVGGLWAGLDPRLEEAAAVLGASRLQVLYEVTFPLLLPAIAAAALLVFLFTFNSFGVILILGGPRMATLEVEIYRQTIFLFNLPLAATLAILQVVVTFGMMGVYTGLQQRMTVPLSLRAERSIQRPIGAGRDAVLVVASVGIVLLLVAGPLLALVERSLTISGDGLSLSAYRALTLNPTRSAFFVPPVAAIRNSLLFAVITTLLSLPIGLLSAYFLAPPRGLGAGAPIMRRLFDPLFMLPLGTSAVTLGLGYIIALDEPPLNLRTSPVLIPLAHTLVAFPFVVRSLLPVLRGINPALREAAAVLGAAPLRVLREIDLPLLGRPLLVGAVFAFAISIGEFGATALVWRPEWPTMPVVIFRFLGQPGALNYAQALAMSTLLMVVTAAGFLVIERVRYAEIGEF